VSSCLFSVAASAGHFGDVCDGRWNLMCLMDC
jgi:hypothetical protein